MRVRAVAVLRRPVPYSNFSLMAFYSLMRQRQRLGILGRMGMFGPGVNLEFLQHGATQAILGQHALHGSHQDAGGLVGQHVAENGGLETADPAGVPVIFFIGHFFAGNFDLFAVNYHDKVPVIHMRGEFRLVLAAQAVGDLAGQTTEHLILSVNHEPFAIDVFGGGAERLHRSDSSHLQISAALRLQKSSLRDAPSNGGDDIYRSKDGFNTANSRNCQEQPCHYPPTGHNPGAVT
ncbi:hypothetical protein KL86DES1_10499 [uncultured Desulfovibrio sp.]|uniref:Uncharacterized protein n=1 Tax=uncultured Desulfovibrio sp. TaxID=167968 RepID=A0A212KZ70_9BACT|nr:hypothetical protein KL86DES1_10499 [uncultured Desulfovibrio sp.]VZH32373.1 conserved protein of unknown function [Desulfovibrio sp. 86]